MRRSTIRFGLTAILLFLGLTWRPLTAGGQEPFRAGMGMRIITPDPLLPVSGGVGEPNAVTGKRGELTVRAMVLSSGQQTVAFVSVDVLGFPSVLGDRVRRLVPRIPAENILIGATHTHSAPDCYGFPLPSGGHTGDLKYMDLVCTRAAEAVNEAIDRLQPGELKVGTGRAADRIAYNYYAPQLYDPRMSVIQVTEASEKHAVIGTLVNYAIHPEVLGSDAGILSPDVIGPLCEKLEQQVGGVAMFMNGAQGGMVTADNRLLEEKGDPLRAVWPDARTWEECLRIGHLMADEAQRILATQAIQKSPMLDCRSVVVRFPVESPLMWAIIAGSPLKYPHHPDHSIESRINLVSLGNARILTIPGEALPNIGFYLKRKLAVENAMLFGLTNDAFGYILTEVDFASFDRYSYVSRTSLGERTGTILIEQSLRLIESAAAGQAPAAP